MVLVGAAQIKVVDDVSVNLSKILTFIAKAASKKIDIICFPEVCLNSNPDPSVSISKELQSIQSACKNNKIWCVFGSYVPAGRKARNVIFLIDRDGKIRYEYDKVHLWGNEKKTVIAGKRNRVVETEFGKIGIINCWDCAFPGFIQKLGLAGAKIIFCPVYECDVEKDHDVFRKIPLVRAFENLAYFVWCDAFTPETLSESVICHPLHIIEKIVRKEGLIVADLDLKEIAGLKKEYDHLG